MLNQEKQDKLQSMQNRFLRIVYNQVNMSTEDMHANICVGKLREQRELHLCGLMYKRSKDIDYIDARNLPTRQFDKVMLKTPDVVLSKSFNIPMFKGSNLWNNLTIFSNAQHIKNSSTDIEADEEITLHKTYCCIWIHFHLFDGYVMPKSSTATYKKYCRGRKILYC